MDRMDKLEKVVQADHEMNKQYQENKHKAQPVPAQKPVVQQQQQPQQQESAETRMFTMPTAQRKLVFSVDRYKLDTQAFRGLAITSECKLVAKVGAQLNVLESFSLPEFVAMPMNWWKADMQWDDYPVDKQGNPANAVMCAMKQGERVVGFFTAHAGPQNDANVPLTNGHGGQVGVVGANLYHV
eukprot:TRINITY_DN6180_c0_g1_i2.p1 TRINITY_DN6180_c0_g1~~TRINITY_DN6180_c0_g1_i2.p1  ORF type:complete len:184 (-),score=57.93 TRINITY_DN6180_c0_g1_i2:814-1365(-)